MNYIPNWSTILTLCQIVALLSTAISSYYQYHVARKSVENKLFNDRYQFYKEAQLALINNGSRGGEGFDMANKSVHIDLLPDQAELLFGQDISKHLKDTAANRSQLDNPSFLKPFLKYFNDQNKKWWR
jgi:hypothetical protein